ncbi:dnaJ homolog subfamily B member 13-like [Synchiropus picturatus]
MDQDYYEILQVSRSATDSEIKNAYRRLALKFHPSNNKEPESLRIFTELGEAYDVLCNPLRKATYDIYGEKGLKGGLDWSSKYAYHGNPEKTFRQFFGADMPFSDFYADDAPLKFAGLTPEVVKVQDPPIEKELHLTLDDLFHGRMKKVMISRRVMNEDGCTYSNKDKILTIHVQPGWNEGTRIVFPREGDQGTNIIPADIIFIVREKSHPLFVRQGDDLIYKTQISLLMALTCFSVTVKTLDSRELNIPINEIVHPSYKKVVPGEGMPLFEERTRRGNLILIFDINFPGKLSVRRRQLITQALLFKK